MNQNLSNQLEYFADGIRKPSKGLKKILPKKKGAVKRLQIKIELDINDKKGYKRSKEPTKWTAHTTRPWERCRRDEFRNDDDDTAPASAIPIPKNRTQYYGPTSSTGCIEV